MNLPFARWSGGPAPALASVASSDLPLRITAPRAGAAIVPTRATTWTSERIGTLATAELRLLLANAERLLDPRIAELCREAIGRRPAERAQAHSRTRAEKGERHLVSRNTAFGLRGVGLADRFTSRSGVTRHGEVVFALWAGDVRRDGAGASCLLWSPNTNGARPWSDLPAGRERHEHCRRALAKGSALGLLVHGERLEGVLPEERAASVEGVDPSQALALQVEKRGEDYWATWGRRLR